MPLYRLDNKKVVIKIKPAPFPKEKELQRLFEANLEALLGVRFIATEFSTGDRQRGRIDTLGIDQDGYPTIIEYKKTNKENVINQGLFYLDWLVDHKGDFTLAAQMACGVDVKIDWSHPRLILVAETFSEYDKYAVNRIGANVDLLTYRLYGEDLLYLETLYATERKVDKSDIKQPSIEKPSVAVSEENALTPEEKELQTYTVEGHLENKPQMIKDLFEMLRERIFSLGSDETITEKANKKYIGYKHGQNFVEIQIQMKSLRIWLDISPEDLHDPFNIARDVRNIGHHGTGDVEVRLSDSNDLEKVADLIEQSYQQTV